MTRRHHRDDCCCCCGGGYRCCRYWSTTTVAVASWQRARTGGTQRDNSVIGIAPCCCYCCGCGCCGKQICTIPLEKKKSFGLGWTRTKPSHSWRLAEALCFTSDACVASDDGSPKRCTAKSKSHAYQRIHTHTQTTMT